MQSDSTIGNIFLSVSKKLIKLIARLYALAISYASFFWFVAYAESLVDLIILEAVNKLVLDGMPFRDAYKKVATDVESGNFFHSDSLNHTHVGSMGNLCNNEIKLLMRDIVLKFNFNKVKIAFQQLLG